MSQSCHLRFHVNSFIRGWRNYCEVVAGHDRRMGEGAWLLRARAPTTGAGTGTGSSRAARPKLNACTVATLVTYQCNVCVSNVNGPQYALITWMRWVPTRSRKSKRPLDGLGGYDTMKRRKSCSVAGFEHETTSSWPQDSIAIMAPPMEGGGGAAFDASDIPFPITTH